MGKAENINAATSGPAWRNAAVPTAATTPFATIEIRHQALTAGGNLFDRLAIGPPAEMAGSSGTKIFQNFITVT
jgi:hypothetical protein